MNKTKMSAGSRNVSRPQRSFTAATEVDGRPVFAAQAQGHKATKTASTYSEVVDFRGMAKEAAVIHDHIANGGKPNDLSGIKFFNPAGLFHNGK